MCQGREGAVILCKREKKDDGWPDVTVRVPRGGQRGLRLPRFLARIGNGMMLRNFRRGDARTQGGIEVLMLETVGREVWSGAPIGPGIPPGQRGCMARHRVSGRNRQEPGVAP
jgi:hypothetical protein